MTKLCLYFHTLRYLKLKQIYYRLVFKILKPAADRKPRPNIRKSTGVWVEPCRRNQSLLDSETFLFFNHRECLSRVGWNGDQMNKLWRYNQHYFDDLNAQNSPARISWHVDLLMRWIEDNPCGSGNGWEPYPTSIRIVNWIKWQYFSNKLPTNCAQSLSEQTRWLSRRIEWHIMGNHLFANAKALVFSGLFFEGDEADRWLSIGLKILKEELSEQVLDDGANFELTPMYHLIFLEDLLDLINITSLYPNSVPAEQIAEWRQYVVRMLKFLLGVCHPDGEISYFNDSAIGVAPNPGIVLDYAKRLGIDNENLSSGYFPKITFKQFKYAGYIRIESSSAVAILDVGNIGPDYLPGHAHADSLSFELSLFRKRLIVNCGTSEYVMGDIRSIERSTMSHSTVEIDKESSSEVWASFRVARRAYPVGLDINTSAESIRVSCAHNGYARLPGSPMHHRNWFFKEDKLAINDYITGSYSNAVARFHLHPEVDVVEWGSKEALLKLSDKMVVFRVLEGELMLEPSFYVVEFGKRQASQSLAVHFKYGEKSAIELIWENSH